MSDSEKQEVKAKVEAKPKAKPRAKPKQRPTPQVVDHREVLPEAEYKRRISKLHTSAKLNHFRSKYRRGN